MKELERLDVPSATDLTVRAPMHLAEGQATQDMLDAGREELSSIIASGKAGLDSVVAAAASAVAGELAELASDAKDVGKATLSGAKQLVGISGGGDELFSALGRVWGDGVNEMRRMQLWRVRDAAVFARAVCWRHRGCGTS